MGVLRFYGSDRPDLFRIERESMDRRGAVIDYLDNVFPRSGRVLDIGGGNGHTAALLGTLHRTVVAAEPSRQMIEQGNHRPTVQAEAGALPFSEGTFIGAYATWAYFFPAAHDIGPGLRELVRVTDLDGMIVIIDNAGDDEFSAALPSASSIDRDYWSGLGFQIHVIDTAFDFEDQKSADRLMSLFAGTQQTDVPLTLTYRVAAMTIKAADLAIVL